MLLPLAVKVQRGEQAQRDECQRRATSAAIRSACTITGKIAACRLSSCARLRRPANGWRAPTTKIFPGFQTVCRGHAAASSRRLTPLPARRRFRRRGTPAAEERRRLLDDWDNRFTRVSRFAECDSGGSIFSVGATIRPAIFRQPVRDLLARFVSYHDARLRDLGRRARLLPQIAKPWAPRAANRRARRWSLDESSDALCTARSDETLAGYRAATGQRMPIFRSTTWNTCQRA